MYIHSAQKRPNNGKNNAKKKEVSEKFSQFLGRIKRFLDSGFVSQSVSESVKFQDVKLVLQLKQRVHVLMFILLKNINTELVI